MHHRLAVLLLPLLLAGCGGAAPSPSPTPSAEGFYLRAWVEQALPPEHTFGWLPMATISDDVFLSGLVAVPAIFPGPLVVMPHARAISAAGQQQIIEQARQLGLLSGETDFTGGRLAPGGQTARLEMIVNGRTFDLTGLADPMPAAQPPSAAAFGMFWQRLSTLEEWMPGELGPASAYTPQRISVAFVAPHDPSGLEPNRVAWPLERPFADTGEAWVMPETRCATFEGDELEALLPVLTASTQITIFVDSTDAERGLLVRPLVPGEPTPCGAPA